MKLLVFLIFAGCAVKCDESGNYYVIERPSDSPVRELRPFQVYWNVPTFQCKSKKIVFEHLFEKYGIIQNQNDTFQGEQITILYDPGLFPAILQEESSGKLRTRNGGVPQEGNLDEHLTAFRFVLDQSIPDPQFSGIGIIDFESWRPVFRQNSWGVLTPYRNLSLLIERRLHPWWTKGMIEREAKYRFERSGREFMQATLALARLLRPRAKWGYYGFPYCFNMAGSKPAEACSNIIQKENDQISWLWAESTALHPSLYSSQSLAPAPARLAALVRGRVAEAARVARGAPILPYFWFKYRDAGFMSEVDLKAALKAMYKSHTSGFILWGSSNDVNSISKCEKLKNYLEQVLGPEVAKYTKQTYKIDESYNISNDTKPNVTTQNPFFLTTDPKDDDNIPGIYSEEANENSSEIIQKLDDEMMSSTNDTGKIRVGKNILIDIVLSLIENIQKQYNKEEFETTMKKVAKDRKKGTPIHDTFTTSREDDSEFTTKSPYNNFRKKGSLFALLYQNKNTTKQNKTTYPTEESSTDHDLRSTTADLLYDYENYTSYNNTLLDENFNYTTISESNFDSNTVSNKEDETTASIFFENEFTTSTVSTTVTISNTIDETTVPIFFDNEVNFPNNTTEILYDESSTSKTHTSTTEESTTQSYVQTTDVKGSTTDEPFSITDATTRQDTVAVPETVYDDPEYQVVIALE